MAGRRCSICGIDYAEDVTECRNCGEPTWYASNIDPPEDEDRQAERMARRGSMFVLDVQEALQAYDKMCARWADARPRFPIPPSFECYTDACRRYYDRGAYHMTYRDVAIALLNGTWPKGRTPEGE